MLKLYFYKVLITILIFIPFTGVCQKNNNSHNSLISTLEHTLDFNNGIVCLDLNHKMEAFDSIVYKNFFKNTKFQDIEFERIDLGYQSCNNDSILNEGYKQRDLLNARSTFFNQVLDSFFVAHQLPSDIDSLIDNDPNTFSELWDLALDQSGLREVKTKEFTASIRYASILDNDCAVFIVHKIGIRRLRHTISLILYLFEYTDEDQWVLIEKIYL